VQKSTSADIHDIFYDAPRIISRFYSTIERWALHTYYSDRPFMPTKCIENRKYVRATALAFSQDDSRLAAGFPYGAVTLWNTCYPCRPIADQEGHSGKISTLAFSPDGVRLASGSHDKTVRLWDGRGGAPIITIILSLLIYSTVPHVILISGMVLAVIAIFLMAE